MLALIAVPANAQTVQPKLTPTLPKDTKLQPSPAAAAAATAPPVVTGLQPAGACVSKGSSVVVMGRNFGGSNGKGIALGGQGIHVDLPVSSWSGASISVTIPNDSRIQGGKWYYIGVEKADHSQWLSNIDKTITICSSPTTALAPLGAPTLRTAPTPTTPRGPFGASDTESSTQTDSGYVGPGPTPTVPAGGGSLLQTQLPPPPQDVPPAPVKESAAIEPAELVIVSANMAEAQQLATQLQALRLSVKRRTNLPGLGFVVTVLRVPKEVGVGNALLSLRQALPNAWADANHRMQLMGDETKTYGQKLIGWNASPTCGVGIRIGLVDTALDTNHPKLRPRKIERRDFLTTGAGASSSEHGTATASLLIGQEIGLVPGAQLFAANVFRTREKETDTTAEWVVLALNWLAENRVAIVNLSLGGPRNLLVEAAVQRLLETGIAVVAAAGNGGDSAPPVFPAAQSGVVAVTAIGADLSPYRKSNRGDYIGFAAPGVDVWAAAPGKDGVYFSGTSYATPFVTATLATTRLANPKSNWPAVIKQLQSRARDLGAAGKDPVFGWGLIQASGCTTRKF